MFEIEKMNQKFDYSIVDSDTADFLKSCEYEINGIAEDARVRIGGVLKKAQEKLANNHKGVFQKWLLSSGITKDNAYYYINLYNLSLDLDKNKMNVFLNAPKSLQVEAMKRNVSDTLKEKVFNGEITTHKEYKELQKELKSKINSTKNIKKQEILYIVSHKGFEGFYKIGVTSDLSQRVAVFETASPLGVEILYNRKTDSVRSVESIVHKKYEDKRRNGEWFELSKEELDEVKQYLDNLTQLTGGNEDE